MMLSLEVNSSLVPAIIISYSSLICFLSAAGLLAKETEFAYR